MDEVQPGSLQAFITGDMAKRGTQEVQKIAVPRFNGRLVARYKAVDARTLIRIGIDAEADADPVEGVIKASVRALLASCEGTETEIDGKVEDLGMPLGAELAAFLGFSGAQNDAEGVHLIFEDELDIVESANELRQFQQLASRRINEAIVGNSEAVG